MSRPSQGPGDLVPLSLREDLALVVTGSLSTKPQDRTMTRADVVPVQVVTAEGTVPVPFFRHEGEHGVASALITGRQLLFSMGDDLGELDLETGTVTWHDIPGLRDVHEMTLHDTDVLLANTGADEAIVFSPADGMVRARITLDLFRRATVEDPTGSRGEGGEDAQEAVDRYHLNQVFVDEDGESWALVHHVTGKQLIRRIAEKVIKSQGNGGVINLSDGRFVPLQLHAPHSVRAVAGEYWVLDSGRGEARVYTPAWEHTATANTLGWGRGADLAPDGSVLYVGMSPIRKRYLPFLPDRSCFQCCVEAFDTETKASVGVVFLDAIEQINNVLIVDRQTAELLVAVPPRAVASTRS